MVSRASRHRTVGEIWYILEGGGEIWRWDRVREEVTPLALGLCLTIPVGASFQFRAAADAALSMFAVTLPPMARRTQRRVDRGRPMLADSGLTHRLARCRDARLRRRSIECWICSEVLRPN